MGHNSAEDALMCMKLMKKKVEKDCENANKPVSINLELK